MLLAKFFRQRHEVVDVVAVPVQTSMGDGVELPVDQAWCTAETSLFGQVFEKSRCCNCRTISSMPGLELGLLEHHRLMEGAETELSTVPSWP